jgi:hypothetical protein
MTDLEPVLTDCQDPFPDEGRMAASRGRRLHGSEGGGGSENAGPGRRGWVRLARPFATGKDVTHKLPGWFPAA